MSRCYVGALPPDPPEEELCRVFEGVGEIQDIQVKKTISGDWYAFIHYKDPDAADEAIKRYDHHEFHGCRLRVELPFASDKRGGTRRTPRRPYPSGGRVTVKVFGIPSSGSWQDLKDHFRGAGDCVYADTFGDGTGIVEYNAYEDAQRAVSMFDSSVFKSHQGESSRIQLEIAAPMRAGSSGYRSKPYDSYRDSKSYYRDDRGPYRDERDSRDRDYDEDRYEDRRYYSRERSYGPVRYSERAPPPSSYRSRYDGPPPTSSYNGGPRSRSRSPQRRSSRYGTRRSSPSAAHNSTAAVGYESSSHPLDDRYTTQDSSRSTEAYSSTGGDPGRNSEQEGRGGSPPRRKGRAGSAGPPAGEEASSWPMDSTKGTGEPPHAHE